MPRRKDRFGYGLNAAVNRRLYVVDRGLVAVLFHEELCGAEKRRGRLSRRLLPHRPGPAMLAQWPAN